MPTTSYYGNNVTNIDLKTGIRYGVIQMHAITQAWCDSAVPVYPETPEGEEQDDDAEPLRWEYREDGYVAEADDDGDVFVLKSPYVTFAQFCSPCAPGACHLGNPLSEPHGNNRCYCFGHDWFEDGVAPYPVYNLATMELVKP